MGICTMYVCVIKLNNMKKVLYLFQFVFFLLANISLNAQTAKVLEKANATTADVSNTVNATTKSIDDLKKSKDILRGIFPQKVKSTAIILKINKIEFSNADLLLLEKAIADVKGVKNVNKTFKDEQISFEIKCKKNAGELLNAIDSNALKPFKILQSDTNLILLELSKK
jgi:hypothetical protein